MNYENIIKKDKETRPQHFKYLLHKNKDIIGPFLDDNLNKLTFNYYVSDQFKPVEKNKSNMLFAGCSITVGCGVKITEKTWSYMLYEEFSKREPVAGYFNVSCSGASAIEILFNVFKYIAKYGYPDYIFILFPDYGRDWFKFNTLGDNKENFEHNRELRNGKILDIFLFNMYSVLEDMCKTNNIKLFSTSWIDTVPGVTDIFTSGHFKEFEDYMHNEMKKSFTTYYEVDKKRFQQNVYSYIKENDPTMTIVGTDDTHPSEAVHYAWFKEAQFKLEESLNVNNGN